MKKLLIACLACCTLAACDPFVEAPKAEEEEQETIIDESVGEWEEGGSINVDATEE